MAVRFYIDITELLGNPVRTGIQRVVRETLRHWPSADELTLCAFDAAADALVEVPVQVLDLLLETDSRASACTVDSLREGLAAIVAASPRVPIPSQGAPIIVPELFFDERRCKFYIRKLAEEPENVFLLFYDFIPWLRPDDIGVERAAPLMHYVRVAQNVRNAAFISEQTGQDWRERIVRRPHRNGRVIPLGADGLGLERQRFDRSKRTFVCLGSIDGRKNQHLILRAFRQLWREGGSSRLAIVGRAFDSASDIAKEVAGASGEPLFRHYAEASDDEVSAILRSARATIYVSASEGFGLPPVESLRAGVPVISTVGVPSVAGLDGKGVILIDRIDPDSIAAAVRRLEDDQIAREAWASAAALRLPTWRDFGRAVNDWVRNAA